MNLDEYEERARGRECFICAHIAGPAGARHHPVYQDESCVAFLNRYPTLRGYTLVAPRAHIVDVTGDRELFRHVTDVVHDVAEALKLVLPVERVYVMSLGSHQGNAHVHWHVAPLPPGVPYRDQQFHALMTEHGVLDVPDAEQRKLAARIRAAIGHRR
jgi:histidine triad (HIT) family protein/ATP adenylyltransferase